jgi:hypothetical protein
MSGQFIQPIPIPGIQPVTLGASELPEAVFASTMGR